ncbi:MAG: hypothetical protein OEN00_15300, partial [Gemmatimonadota bacterium]|nr:hypothetical protein [Gemmatimonadota bacterium]
TADFYLRKKYGIPVDTIQTYLEHILTGPVPGWYRERFPQAARRRATQPEPTRILEPTEPSWLAQPRRVPVDTLRRGRIGRGGGS